MLGMSSNITNIAPYLQTTRLFPTADAQRLETELSKMNLDTAVAVNLRSIGIYDKTLIVTGNTYFNDANPQRKRQSQREVYTLPATAAGATTTIAHGINVIAELAVPPYGTCITDAPDFRGIPYASATDVTKQIEIKVDSTNITVINGAGGPNITSGFVVLEFLQT
jgi:hypothetical protein